MASIEKYKEELARLRGSKKSAIAAIRSKTEKVTHTVLSAGTAYVVGAADAKGKNPLPDLFGLDKKLVWGVAAHMAATAASGKVADTMSSVGDGLISSYAYCEGAGKGYKISGQYGYQDMSADNLGADDNYIVDDFEV